MFAHYKPLVTYPALTYTNLPHTVSSPLAKSTVSIGDILVAVNGRDVIYEELEDVIEFIHMIKYAFYN